MFVEALGISSSDPKAQMTSEFRGSMITLSPVKVCRRRSRTWKWWKTSKQDRTKRLLFGVEQDKEMQALRELKMPLALPGYRGVTLPGRNKAEGGREGKERGRKTGGERGDECASKPKSQGRRMRLEVASLGRRHLKPTAPRQRLDLLASPAVSSTGRARWGIKAP